MKSAHDPYTEWRSEAAAQAEGTVTRGGAKGSA
jgi:hypothetical protein